MLIGKLRAVTRYLFVNRKQQSDFVAAFSAKLFGGRNLSSDNSFGITGAPSVNKLVVFARGDERWHRVHMRREHNAWPGFRGGDDIRSFICDVLELNMVSEPHQQFAQRGGNMK